MVDFHTHTIYSDGKVTPDFLIRKAIKEKLSYLAITDHNYLHEDLDLLQKEYKGKICLVDGIELSTVYDTKDGRKIEVHVVGLLPDHEIMKKFLLEHGSDREGYLSAMRKKFMENCGISIPDYKEFKRRNPESSRIGRVSVGNYLVEQGIVSSVDEAFQIYFGSNGEKRAYVDALEYSSYAPFEEGVQAILQGGGIPVLAHLYTYPFEEKENQRILKRFQEVAGKEQVGMEVFYKKYSQEQQEQLKKMADCYGFYYSSASDYHGKKEEDTLMDREHLKACNMERHVWSLIQKRKLSEHQEK